MKRKKISCFIFFVLNIFIYSNTLASNWKLYCLQPSDLTVNSSFSIALDQKNYPHITYYDGKNGDLIYAYFNGSWNKTTIDGTNSDVGIWSSVALDSSNNTHIAYLNYTNKDLKYAYFDSNTWNIETVYSTGDVGYDASITLDSNNNPHLAYTTRHFTDIRLRYATKEGDIWHHQEIDQTGVSGNNIAMVIDNQGKIIIAHCKWWGKWGIWLASGSLDNWIDECVQLTHGGTRSPCLRLDGNQFPHIAYQVAIRENIVYEHFDGNSWIETVIDDGESYSNVSMALDNLGNPHFLYDIDNFVTHAFWEDGSLTKEIIANGKVGKDSIEIDTSGNLHIIYYDSTNKEIRYAIGVPPKPVQINIDIKPGSCPNPVNVQSKGVMPVAVLGSEVFDVNDIDPNSLEIFGVGAIRYSYEDVAAPADVNALPEECVCTTDGPDGYPDMTLKFDTPDIVEAIGEVNDGDYVVLTLTGFLKDGTPIEGTDCIMIIDKRKP